MRLRSMLLGLVVLGFVMSSATVALARCEECLIQGECNDGKCEVLLNDELRCISEEAEPGLCTAIEAGAPNIEATTVCPCFDKDLVAAALPFDFCWADLFYTSECSTVSPTLMDFRVFAHHCIYRSEAGVINIPIERSEEKACFKLLEPYDCGGDCQ